MTLRDLCGQVQIQTSRPSLDIAGRGSTNEHDAPLRALGPSGAPGRRIVGCALLALIFVSPRRSSCSIRSSHGGDGDFSRVTIPAGIISSTATSRRPQVRQPDLRRRPGALAPYSRRAVIVRREAAGRRIRHARHPPGRCAYLVLFAAAFALVLWAGVPALLCALLAWARSTSRTRSTSTASSPTARPARFLASSLPARLGRAPTGGRGGRRLPGALLVLAALTAAFSSTCTC